MVRISILYILLICMALNGHSQEVVSVNKIMISDSYFGQRLYATLSEWEQEYQLKFDFRKGELPDFFLGDKYYDNVPLADVIDDIFSQLNLHYKIESNRTIIVRKNPKELLYMRHPTRRNFTFRGQVIDGETGETLPYATVYVKHTIQGATTNVDGYFSIMNMPSDTSTIIIQYIGYKTAEIKLYPEMLNEDGPTVFSINTSADELDEVVVLAQQEHMMKASGISTVSVSPKQLAMLPGLGEKDIFRSLQMLPGISATNETSSGLYVRGGTPDQNLVLFDGFTVYHVDHFYGFFSAFNANAVKDVQLYKGGFEAKYGGRISSVVDLTGKNGNTESVSGNVGVSAISVNGSVEAPFDDGKGSVFIGARRSFTDIIRSGLYNDVFDLFEEETQSTQQRIAPGGGGGRFGFNQVENEPDFYFYDLNAKISYRPSTKEIVSISFYNGVDKLDNSNEFNNQGGQGFGGFGGGNGGNTGTSNINNNTTDLNNWGNLGSSIRWGRQWTDKIFTNTVLSYSKYFTDRDSYTLTEVTRDDSTFTTRNGTLEDNNVLDFTFRTDVEYLLSDNHKLDFGLQSTDNRINYTQVRNDTINVLDRNDKGYTAAVYVQDTWRPIQSLSIVPGIRLSWYSGTSQYYSEPRLSLSYQLSKRLTIKGAWGKYYQFVTRVVREDFTQGSRDFWLMATEDINPVSSSTHYIAGFSYELDQFLFDVEAYHKDMQGLTEYTLRFANNFRGQDRGTTELFYEGTGYSRGIEFLIQKKVGVYTGWIGYTLSEVIHNFPGIADHSFYALNDQTHEFKIVNSLRAGHWTFSATWVYATGKPYTSPVGGYEITLLDGSVNSYVSVGEKNAYRLPDYHRMDVSINYGWDWGAKTKAEVGLSVFNFYNRTNVWYKTYNIVEDELIVTDVNTIGFTPNLFINLMF